MMTLEKALNELGHQPDRVTLETYIARAWVRPAQQGQQPHFEAIDVARARLVHQLHAEMHMDENAMDVVLGLLDQLYGLHERMRRVHHAISRQPQDVRSEILALIREMDNE